MADANQNIKSGTDDPEGDAFFASEHDLAMASLALSWPTIDPNLNSHSEYGMGFMYRELWELLKSYILKGDETYQQGGLSMLEAIVWHIPLGEAADVLEQYFRGYHYVLPAGGRGGVNLFALQAAYAVGTTFSWDGSEIEHRQERMVKLLENYKFRVTQLGWEDDAKVVQDAIDATRSNKADFKAERWPDSRYAKIETEFAIEPNREPQYADLTAEGGLSIEGSATLTSEARVDTAPSSAVSLADVETLIKTALEHSKSDTGGAVLSQSELMEVKHGYDLLKRDLVWFKDKVEDQGKSIDRYLSHSQVKFTVWGIVITAVLAIIALVVAIYFGWLQVYSPPFSP